MHDNLHLKTGLGRKLAKWRAVAFSLYTFYKPSAWQRYINTITMVECDK